MTALSKHLTAYLPTTSAQVARLLIYQLTREPIETVGDWLTTDWGRARIKGRIGQRHADVMEIMQRTALQVHVKKDGCVNLLVDPHIIRKGLTTGKQRRRTSKRILAPLYSAQGLEALIDGLRDADVEWELKNGLRGGVTKIIKDREWAKVSAPDPLHPNQGRQLWKITLSSQWVALTGNIALWYDPTAIVRMNNGISQAIARLLLGHDRKKWYGQKLALEEAFDQMKIPRGQARWDAKRRVRQDADGFLVYGLEIAGDHVINVQTGTDA